MHLLDLHSGTQESKVVASGGIRGFVDCRVFSPLSHFTGNFLETFFISRGVLFIFHGELIFGTVSV